MTCSFRSLASIFFLILPITMILSCGGGGSGGGSVLTSVDESLQGQWLYVDTGTKVWLGETTYLKYSKINENLLSTTCNSTYYEDPHSNSCSATDTYYLLRAGVENVQLTGKINSLENVAGKVAMKTLYSSAAGSGKPSVIMKNIKNNKNEITLIVNPADGSFTNDSTVEIPSGEYEINVDDGEGNIAETTVVVEGTLMDLGAFTPVTSVLYNFKAQLLSENDYLYFGAKIGQTSINYNKTIRVHNIGNQQVSGLSFVLSCDDPDVSSFSYDNVLGGVDVGGYIDIPIRISFNRPSAEKKVRIDVAIKDINNQTWNDYLALTLSPYIPVKINVGAKRETSVNGYLVAPGRAMVKVNSGDFIRVPYIPGESYQMVFTNPDINSEVAYSVGVGKNVNSSVFNTFSDTSINEPDNEESSATNLGLNDEMVSYLHAGDIDYYTISFDGTKDILDPTIVGSVDTPYLVYDIAILGNYAYVVTASEGLQIINISDPSAPVIVGSLDTPGAAYNITVSGDYAYVRDDSEGLQIVDVSDPSTPAIIGSLALDYLYDTIVLGNYAYLATGSNGLKIVDISNPTTPVVVGAMDTSGAYNVAVSGNYAYISADFDTDIEVVDISDPAKPFIVASVSIYSYWASMAISGNYLYAGFNERSSVIDISDPTAPVIVGSWRMSYVRDIAISGNYAYVATGTGIEVIDVSDPTSPSPVYNGTVTIGVGTGYSDVALSGEYAYVSGEDLYIVKIR